MSGTCCSAGYCLPEVAVRIDDLSSARLDPSPLQDCIARPGLGFSCYIRAERGRKSSALRALKSLLFGIPHHTSDNFLTKLKIASGRALSSSEGSGLP
jgi:hypothetical protein